jgi:hypothetical protein
MPLEHDDRHSRIFSRLAPVFRQKERNKISLVFDARFGDRTVGEPEFDSRRIDRKTRDSAGDFVVPKIMQKYKFRQFGFGFGIAKIFDVGIVSKNSEILVSTKFSFVFIQFLNLT